MKKIISHLLQALIINKRREVPFIIFFSFLIFFIATRIWIYLMFSGHIPPMFLYVRIYGEIVHVHHLNYGIAMLCMVGFISLTYSDFTKKYLHQLSVLYGIGLALAFDEFALWLHLEDDYWNRISYDAVIVISAIFLNIIYFPWFWSYLVKKLRLNKTKHLFLFPMHLYRWKKNRKTKQSSPAQAE